METKQNMNENQTIQIKQNTYSIWILLCSEDQPTLMENTPWKVRSLSNQAKIYF